MKKIAWGALVASTMVLAACGGQKASNTTKASNATAPASNSSGSSSSNAAAPAGNTGGAAGGESTDRTNQNFTLNNRSEQTITHVYVSPVSDNEWGPDIMERDVLPAGESVDIVFERAESECNWDIRVTVEGDQNQELRNVNLCTTTDVDYGG
jgi:pectate lyase